MALRARLEWLWEAAEKIGLETLRALHVVEARDKLAWSTCRVGMPRLASHAVTSMGRDRLHIEYGDIQSLDSEIAKLLKGLDR